MVLIYAGQDGGTAPKALSVLPVQCAGPHLLSHYLLLSMALYRSCLVFSIFMSNTIRIDHGYCIRRLLAQESGAVTFGEVSRATHRIAHRLRPHRSGTEGEVVGVLVQCDVILYITLLVGMTRAGLVVSDVFALASDVC